MPGQQLQAEQRPCGQNGLGGRGDGTTTTIGRTENTFWGGVGTFFWGVGAKKKLVFFLCFLVFLLLFFGVVFWGCFLVFFFVFRGDFFFSRGREQNHGTRSETMAILVKALQYVTQRLRAFP